VQIGEARSYRRHAVTDSGISPRALPGLTKALVVTDSDEHDEAGHMIEDAATRIEQDLKRLRKLDGLRKEIGPPVIKEAPKADATLIGWGSTGGAIEEAAAIFQKDGKAVSTIHFNEIWPFPADEVKAVFEKSGKTVVIESNATAQLAGLIRRETGKKVDHTILKYKTQQLLVKKNEEYTALEHEITTLQNKISDSRHNSADETRIFFNLQNNFLTCPVR